MIDDELIKKIDSIEDLPISEEMLGAYLEGNLHGSEFREIKNIIDSDSNISDLVGVVEDDMYFINDLNCSLDNGFEAPFGMDELFDNYSLPEISSLSTHPFIEHTPSLTENIIIDDDFNNFIDNDSHSIHTDDTEHSHHLNHHGPELDTGTFDNY